jgi:hypothetical protein
LEYPVHPWQRLHSASQSCGKLLIGLELAITSTRMESKKSISGSPRSLACGLPNREAKQASPVAKALLATGRNLLEASRVLSGHQTGIHTSVEIQATTEAVRLLALDPTIGSIDTAKTLVGNFHEQSAKIGHACLDGWADLAEEGGQKGRPALHWYDDFSRLLLEIAKRAGVKASIGRDRVTRERTGWLFEAARALEPFLDRWMRSQSPEACGKRLERSMRRLRDLKRHKSPHG